MTENSALRAATSAADAEDAPAEIEALAGQIAEQTGALLLDMFHGPLHVEFKDDAQSNPVSDADKKAEEFLRAAIQKRFPDHAILGEEGKDEGPALAEYTWVLDPLDGTTNYINGLPLFAVSVGVLRQGRPVVGAIWSPVSPDGGPGLFSARAGGGASLNGRKITIADRGPSGAAPVARRLAAVPGGFGLLLGFTGPLRRHAGEPRTLGSMAVEGALVAAGVLQYAILWSPKIWDVAAAVTIVQAAGGSALVRESGRWQELKLFRLPIDKSGGARPLRDWCSPVVIGAPPLANSVTEALGPTLLSRVYRARRHPAVRAASRVARLIRKGFG